VAAVVNKPLGPGLEQLRIRIGRCQMSWSDFVNIAAIPILPLQSLAVMADAVAPCCGRYNRTEVQVYSNPRTGFANVPGPTLRGCKAHQVKDGRLQQ
jgi:hypothetical protein